MKAAVFLGSVLLLSGCTSTAVVEPIHLSEAVPFLEDGGVTNIDYVVDGVLQNDVGESHINYERWDVVGSLPSEFYSTVVLTIVPREMHSEADAYAALNVVSYAQGSYLMGTGRYADSLAELQARGVAAMPVVIGEGTEVYFSVGEASGEHVYLVAVVGTDDRVYLRDSLSGDTVVFDSVEDYSAAAATPVDGVSLPVIDTVTNTK